MFIIQRPGFSSCSLASSPRTSPEDLEIKVRDSISISRGETKCLGQTGVVDRSEPMETLAHRLEVYNHTSAALSRLAVLRRPGESLLILLNVQRSSRPQHYSLDKDMPGNSTSIGSIFGTRLACFLPFHLDVADDIQPATHGCLLMRDRVEHEIDVHHCCDGVCSLWVWVSQLKLCLLLGVPENAVTVLMTGREIWAR